uniref:Uncharacterized protein n=1 Tax=Sphaerodactylus townsendi TaxID=933632 RepID=A0ACB8ETK0_9SAUR
MTCWVAAPQISQEARVRITVLPFEECLFRAKTDDSLGRIKTGEPLGRPPTSLKDRQSDPLGTSKGWSVRSSYRKLFSSGYLSTLKTQSWHLLWNKKPVLKSCMTSLPTFGNNSEPSNYHIRPLLQYD